MIARTHVAAVLGTIVLASTVTVAQAPQPASPDTAKGAIVGTGTFTAFVENMDRAPSR